MPIRRHRDMFVTTIFTNLVIVNSFLLHILALQHPRFLVGNQLQLSLCFCSSWSDLPRRGFVRFRVVHNIQKDVDCRATITRVSLTERSVLQRLRTDSTNLRSFVFRLLVMGPNRV